jgi:DNA-directed RNA polymerase alpha subunit
VKLKYKPFPKPTMNGVDVMTVEAIRRACSKVARRAVMSAMNGASVAAVDIETPV